ncbi:MAG TPA: hypothetical protein VN838_31175 [Bradyrhizobium sp.]|nr:hypothetical protein [Bradyrhizobium sp.]
MATVTVTWAAAAEVIIMDGAEDAVITMAGPAVIIATIADSAAGEHIRDLRRNRRCRGMLQLREWCADHRFVPVKVSRCLRS